MTLHINSEGLSVVICLPVVSSHSYNLSPKLHKLLQIRHLAVHTWQIVSFPDHSRDDMTSYVYWCALFGLTAQRQVHSCIGECRQNNTHVRLRVPILCQLQLEYEQEAVKPRNPTHGLLYNWRGCTVQC